MASVGLVHKITFVPPLLLLLEGIHIQTGLQPVCTSLKLLNWTIQLNVITPGESKRAKAIRLRG